MKKKLQIIFIYLIYLALVIGWFFYSDPYLPENELYLKNYSLKYFKILIFWISSIPLFYYSRKKIAGLIFDDFDLNIGKIKINLTKKISILIIIVIQLLFISDLGLKLKKFFSDSQEKIGATFHYNYNYVNQNHFVLLQDIKNKKLNDKYNVVILGESTLEMIKPERLLDSLRDKNVIIDKINIYNLATSWASTTESIIKLSTLLVDQKVDLIIVGHSSADILRGCNSPVWNIRDQELDYGSFLGPFSNLIRGSQKPIISETLHELNQTFFYKWFGKFRSAPDGILKIKPSLNDDNNFFSSHETFQKNMKTIVKLSKMNNSKILLLSLPILLNENPSNEEITKLGFREKYCVNEKNQIPTFRTTLNTFNLFNDYIKQIAISERTDYLDLRILIQSKFENFNDFVHVSPSGTKILENTLVEKISSIYSEFSKDKNAF